MTVLVRGVLYPSARAAAEALGVTKGTIYSALSRGTIDTVGLGTGSIPTSHVKTIPPRSVTVAGKRFPSIAALARYIGRDPRNVRKSLLRGEKARAGLAVAVMKVAAARENEAMRKVMKAQE